ncbi:hypothetical protein, partial [Pyramidobacter piscolens]|uniref:hypothetical protein n=1 Tax=Pyramidobacter piscolens TaxID=638849 RepID=UPI003AB9057A
NFEPKKRPASNGKTLRAYRIIYSCGAARQKLNSRFLFLTIKISISAFNRETQCVLFYLILVA